MNAKELTLPLLQAQGSNLKHSFCSQTRKQTNNACLPRGKQSNHSVIIQNIKYRLFFTASMAELVVSCFIFTISLFKREQTKKIAIKPLTNLLKN